MTLLIHDLQDFPATNHEFRALGARGGYGRGTAALLRRGWAAGQGRRWTRVAAAVPALGVGRGRARRDADLPSVRVPSAQAPSPRALLRRFFCARPLSVPLPSLRLKAVEGAPIRFQARRGGAEEERGEGGKEAERVGQAMNERGPDEGRTTDKQEPISRNRPYRAFCIGVARKRTQPPIASKQAQAAKRALSRPRPQSQARARTKSVARAATVRIAVTRPQTTAGRPRLATAPGLAHS